MQRICRVNVRKESLKKIEEYAREIIEDVEKCYEKLCDEKYYYDDLPLLDAEIIQDDNENSKNKENENIQIKTLSDNSKYEITGYTNIGKKINFVFEIPKYLKDGAQEALDDDYPLNDARSDFSIDRKYDYLRNVRYDSISKLDDAMTKKVYELLTSDYVYQSRFGDPFRNLISVIEAMKVMKCVPKLLYEIISTLFFSNGKPRFHFSRQSLIVNDSTLPTINPTLLYTVLNLLVALCSSCLSEIDFYFCLYCHFIFAEDSLFDSRLKAKSAMRNYVPEYLDKMSKVLVPRFNDSMIAHDVILKNTKENKIGRDQIKRARIDRKDKIPSSIYSILTMYLDQIITIDDLRTCLIITRYASNAGEYIRTLTELGIEKAVAPNTRGSAVSVPKVISKIVSQTNKELDGFPIDSTYEDLTNSISDLDIMHAIENSNFSHTNLLTERYYFRPLIPQISSNMSHINMDSEWLRFVTVKSAGYIPPESMENLSPLFKKLNAKRIGHLAITVNQYRDANYYLNDLSSIVQANERQQIDRRQRAVVGTSNAMLINALPGYIAEKAVYQYSSAANQGKQRGNCLDLYKLLLMSTKDDMMISSMDISGMDSSIQLALQEKMNLFIGNVLYSMNNLQNNKDRVYAAYNELEIQIDINGQLITDYIGGPFQAFMRDVRSSKQSTTYPSELFHFVKLSPGTFSSGRPDTGSHHTLQLDSIFHSQKWLKFNTARAGYANGLQIMGDDIIKYLSGPIEDTSVEAEEDIKMVDAMGLKAISETSTSGGTFLQQAAYCGRTFPFPDRIGLFTKERGNENPVLEERMKELLALIDDLSSRVPGSDGALILSFFIGVFSARRLVLKMNKKVANNITGLLKSFPHISCTMHGNREESDSVLFSILLPIAWLFSHRGGNLPPFRFMRSDETFTTQHSMTATRGFMQRKLLYDISNGILESQLDVPLLREYGFVDAEFVIKLELSKMFLQAKLDPDTIIDISQLSNVTNQVLDLERTTLSHNAHGKALAKGIKIGDDIVYAYSVKNRLIEVIKNLRSTDEVLQTVSDMLYSQIFKLIKKYGLKSTKDNVVVSGMKNILENSDDFKLQYIIKKVVGEHGVGTVGAHPFSKVVDVIKYGPSLWYNSPSYALYKIIGPAKLTTGVSLESSRVRGRFTHFSTSDPIFEQGFRFYRQNKNQGDMNLFFDAVGIFSLTTRNAYLSVFEYQLQERIPTLDFDLNPRRYYWNSLEFHEMLRYLVRVTTIDKKILIGQNVNLLASSFLFIEAAANPYAYVDFAASEIIFGPSLTTSLTSI